MNDLTPEQEDELLEGVALMRMALDSGKRYSVDDVAARFGIDLDDE